ncbi:hypothetical protein [Acidobacterium sp. S8]|uniref:hypothetical protein n=1 Tax=Acidobacterium sp. S8 TaxID=1641854 RepID=UPI00131B36AA|nr:hypothetical protein [Acidobacterium sp. S8]
MKPSGNRPTASVTEAFFRLYLCGLLNERSFEIVARARRYREAQVTEGDSVRVRIVNLTDAEALEAQLIQSLQRDDVHPLEEARGSVLY